MGNVVDFDGRPPHQFVRDNNNKEYCKSCGGYVDYVPGTKKLGNLSHCSGPEWRNK